MVVGLEDGGELVGGESGEGFGVEEGDDGLFDEIGVVGTVD
jgi:hypothetical protein